MSLSIIACVGKNRELGKKNGLIFNLKNDMKFFRETTKNHKVIMGLKTFESIGRPLPKRENFVLAREKVDVPDAVELVFDLNEFKEKFENSEEEVFVIGGASVYAQFLPFSETLYLTEVDGSDPEADVFFPEFKKSDFSREVLESGTENDLNYEIVKYSRKEK